MSTLRQRMDASRLASVLVRASYRVAYGHALRAQASEAW